MYEKAIVKNLRKIFIVHEYNQRGTTIRVQYTTSTSSQDKYQHLLSLFSYSLLVDEMLIRTDEPNLAHS